MRRFKFIGTQQEAENYQTHIPKCGVIYDEDDFLGNLYICPVSVWQDQYPTEWQEIFEPENNGWISVNDRLPELDGDYLVFDGTDAFMIASFSKREGWILFVDFWEASEISHWMPLPKPPTK